MRLKVHSKITISFIIIVAIILSGIFIYLNSTLKEYTYQRIRSALLKEVLLVKIFLEKDFPGYPRLKEIDTVVDKTGETIKSRVTIIGTDGTVLGDSELDGEELEDIENHLYRPEVQDAINSGIGESIRFSTTIKKHMLYIATVFGKDTPEGIVRLSIPLSDIDLVSNYLKKILAISVLSAFLLAALASLIVSNLISKPLERMAGAANKIAKGDYSQKVSAVTNDEVGDLAQALNYMSEQIRLKIDEVVKSRTRLEAVLLSMFDGVMVVDSKGVILLMNPTLMNILMVKNNPAGKKPLEVLRNIEVQEITDKVLGLTEGVESREISIFLPDEKIFLIHATPIVREEVEGAVLVFHDITELRRLEKVRRDFVANVSHELRTPASNIKGYSETLLDGALGDKENSEDFIRVIHADAERLAVLISDLLDLSKIESGKIELNRKVCSVDAIVKKVISELQKNAKEKNITIKSSIPKKIGKILADEVLIAQALLNIIDNAIKYSHENGLIEVSAQEFENFIEIQVSDNGVGIPEEDLARIFERFYRVDKARSRQLGGTGLGLSIVKHIVQEHGGEVSAESGLGKGSTFSFTIPKA